MISKYKDHVLVLPEDRANEQIANGFLQEPALDSRRIQVLPLAGGWPAIRASFAREHNAAMKRWSKQRIVLLVDFDGQEGRLKDVTSEVNEALLGRVFVLGAWHEPEHLRKDLGSYETIGQALARDCAQQTASTWGHPLLKHNQAELSRLMSDVRPFLFARPPPLLLQPHP